MKKNVLVFLLIVVILSLLPIENLATNFGVSYPTALILKFAVISLIAYEISSYSYTSSRKPEPQRTPAPQLEDISPSLAKDVILKDFRYHPDLRKSIATELQKNTLKAKWNYITHELCIIPAASEPDKIINALIESFYEQQEQIIFQHL
jgi:hypothetical protein